MHTTYDVNLSRDGETVWASLLIFSISLYFCYNIMEKSIKIAQNKIQKKSLTNITDTYDDQANEDMLAVSYFQRHFLPTLGKSQIKSVP